MAATVLTRTGRSIAAAAAIAGFAIGLATGLAPAASYAEPPDNCDPAVPDACTAAEPPAEEAPPPACMSCGYHYNPTYGEFTFGNNPPIDSHGNPPNYGP